jgi:hypothetical protein
VGDRFVDDGRTIYDFGDHFLVRCPRCSRRAEVLAPLNVSRAGLFDPRRFVCAHCGYVRDWTGHVPGEVFMRNGEWCQRPDRRAGISIEGPFDWYFGLPFWLQTPCCGHVLWAYNSRHLSFLRHYVSADLREQLVVKNKSLANSLPTWMKTAKNRDAVLKGLDRLDTLLLES